MTSSETFTSQNGRKRVQLVGHDGPSVTRKKQCIYTNQRAEVVLVERGTWVVRFQPAEGWYVVVGYDQIVSYGDAEHLGTWDLQSEGMLSVCNAREGAVIRNFGYRRRSAEREMVTATGLRYVSPAEWLEIRESEGVTS